MLLQHYFLYRSLFHGLGKYVLMEKNIFSKFQLVCLSYSLASLINNILAVASRDSHFNDPQSKNYNNFDV